MARTPKKRPVHHRPTPEQLDERVTIPLPPEQAIEAIVRTGPHPEGDTEPDDAKKDPAE